VIPSLPGFGFPGPTQQPGWDTTRIARAWAQLMHRLGYERYGAQGGDTGMIISPELGRLDPDHVIGVHVNGLLTFPTGDQDELAQLTDAEHACPSTPSTATRCSPMSPSRSRRSRPESNPADLMPPRGVPSAGRVGAVSRLP
jgi:pimeloyl-ACP methyl ester carboxylesterase